jgi:ATP-dependent helicase HrpA
LNIRVVDADDVVLAEGRDIVALKRALRARESRPALGATGAQSAHRQWDFSEVPETRVIERNGLQLVIYPTLRDPGQAVAPAEARDAAEARALLRGAVTRLALLALGQQARFWVKRLAEERELILASAALGLAGPLADLAVQRIFADCFAPPDEPLPRTREAFEQTLQRGRAQLEANGERIIALLRAVCTEARQLRAALGRLRTSAREAAADLDAQLEQLLSPQFITVTPDPWFGHLPRYLKAAMRRVARLPADAHRDAQLTARIVPFVNAWRELRAAQFEGAQRPQLERLRWMIEELRVSLFAQELRTAVPVSERRLLEQLEQARAEARAQPG